MLLFEFVRELLRLSAQTPALEELFQLPPEIGAILRRLPLLLLLALEGNPATDHSAKLIDQSADCQIPVRRHFGRHCLGSLSILKLEVTQRIRKIDKHAPLLMPNVQIRKRRFLVVALLPFHNQPINLIHALPDLLGERVLLKLREVIEVDIHELGCLNEFGIQFGFRVLTHGCRGTAFAGPLQSYKYKAERTPKLPLEVVRDSLRVSAQTPAREESPQVPPENGAISLVRAS